MFQLFMYVYSCNALSARFFDVDRALNSYFMIMITIMADGPIRYDSIYRYGSISKRHIEASLLQSARDVS